MILIMGASGAVGSGVANLLASYGPEMRLMDRRPAYLPLIVGAQAVAADYTDPSSLSVGFVDVETALIIPGYADPGERWRLHSEPLDAALAAGVKRLVYLSLQGASPESKLDFARDHYEMENRIRASGVAFTFIRPNRYIDYIPTFFGEDGVVRGAAGDGRSAWVSRDDLAAVIATVLTERGHDGKTYDVTGPESLTLAETAARLSALVDRPLSYQPESREESIAALERLGVPAADITSLVSSYEAIAAGELAAISDTVLRLTGSPAATIEQVFESDPMALERLRKGTQT